jgi:hypothetical protein
MIGLMTLAQRLECPVQQLKEAADLLGIEISDKSTIAATDAETLTDLCDEARDRGIAIAQAIAEQKAQQKATAETQVDPQSELANFQQQADQSTFKILNGVARTAAQRVVPYMGDLMALNLARETLPGLDGAVDSALQIIEASTVGNGDRALFHQGIFNAGLLPPSATTLALPAAQSN